MRYRINTLSLQCDIHKNMRIMPKVEKAEEPKERLNADKNIEHYKVVEARYNI